MAKFEDYIKAYRTVSKKETDRYTSFDYCFTYFREQEGKAADSSNMSMSCFVLWSYLASWGMLRGSCQLLQKNPHYLETLIEKIIEHTDLYKPKYDFDHWNDPKVCKEIIKCYNDFAETLKDISPTMTLITKIMLGVYGCVPAMDTNFKKAFNISSTNFNEKLLTEIFDHPNLECLKSDLPESLQIEAYDYNTNQKLEKVLYTKAKLVDMYGFIKGMVLKYQSKPENKNKTEDEILHLFKDGRLPKDEK